MEHLWSTAGATGGNQSQLEGRQKRLKRAKSVAVGCDRLPPGPHGKEGVDGSSPSEGFAKVAAYRPLPFVIRTMGSMRNVHQTSTERFNDRSIAP
jgi:hypothetical protein